MHCYTLPRSSAGLIVSFPMIRLAVALVLLLPPFVHAEAPPPPTIAARAWLLVDVPSGQPIAGRNIDERIEPASLTKLMTAYLAFDALKHKKITLTQSAPVSERAWKAGGSRMFIEPRKPVTVEELLHGMIVQSGNDATIALAELVSGAEATFTERMNKEAERLGLRETHFTNASGWPDPKHYSTARDLATLAGALIRDFPEYYPLYATKEYRYNNITQPNRNRLLWLDPNVDGVKTGHTDVAGYCLIASAKRGPRRLISVVLGTNSDAVRAQESQKLLNYGFQYFDSVRLYEKGQEVSRLRVWKGTERELKAGLERDLYFVLPRGDAEKLKADLVSEQPLIAPVSTGQRVGLIRVALDGKPIGEYPVVALESVNVAGFFGKMWDTLRLWANK
jgi:D-alanyl-D-alanine carboxypeptidase (penicillin-binding protein 5/6)